MRVHAAFYPLYLLHRRTLNRRLEDEGTTFRQVLEDVRFDVACQLLSATALSVDDIAGLAGVSRMTSPTTAGYAPRLGR